MKIFLACLLLVNCALFSVTPDEALASLKEGNQRFIRNQLIHQDLAIERLSSLTEMQKPFAIVVGCSDSRATPEIVFDQNLGDLFVVRVAGNVVGETQMDSITYAVLVLKASLIVVLGHESCGAIKSVLQKQDGIIPDVSRLVELSITGTPDVYKATVDNIRFGMAKIKKSEFLKKAIEDKQIKIVGGYFHLKSGEVDFFE